MDKTKTDKTETPTDKVPTTIVPAIAVKEQFLAAWTKTLAEDHRRLRFYQTGPGSNWMPDVPEDDWHKIWRVVFHGDEMLGLLGANIDRTTRTVTNLQLVSFQPGSIRFLRAAQRWMEGLRHKFVSMRWVCLVGNPVAPSYKKWAEANGGGLLCTMTAWGMVEEELTDAYLYEVPGHG